jgi:hypothetical protein
MRFLRDLLCEVARASNPESEQLGRRITVGIESCIPSVRLGEHSHHLSGVARG